MPLFTVTESQAKDTSAIGLAPFYTDRTHFIDYTHFSDHTQFNFIIASREKLTRRIRETANQIVMALAMYLCIYLQWR